MHFRFKMAAVEIASSVDKRVRTTFELLSASAHPENSSVANAAIAAMGSTAYYEQVAELILLEEHLERWYGYGLEKPDGYVETPMSKSQLEERNRAIGKYETLRAKLGR
jgi:hypothetical protein